MARKKKITVTCLSVVCFLIAIGVHSLFTQFNKVQWEEWYFSCHGNKQSKHWEGSVFLIFLNFAFLLVNVNYKESLNNLTLKKDERSEINHDLINMEMHEFSSHESDDDSNSEDSEIERNNICNKNKIRYLYNIKRSRICYFTMWILCYYSICFFSLLSFIYGIRILNNTIVSIYTLRTCDMEDVQNYILSERTFICFYWALINFNVFISKYNDPTYISNYFKINLTINDNKKRIMFLFTYFYQVILLIYFIFENVTLFFDGEYALNQLINSIIFVFLSLYVILEITQVLEVNIPNYLNQPKLPFNYIWSIICLFVIFVSSIIFYISVFSYSMKDVFLNFQFLLWLFFFSLTHVKKPQIFMT